MKYSIHVCLAILQTLLYSLSVSSIPLCQLVCFAKHFKNQYTLCMRILQDAGIATTFSQLRQIPHLPHPVQRIPFTVYRISYPPQPVLPLPVLCLMCYASTELYCILLCRFALCSGIWNFFPSLSTPHPSSPSFSAACLFVCPLRTRHPHPSALSIL